MASTILKSDHRYPFSRQPAHCLIIDFTSKRFNSQAIHEVSLGISNFFTLVCSMATGPSRIPFFAIFVITPYTEIVLPYQRLTKSTNGRIEASLQEMKKLFSDGSVQMGSSLDVKSLEYSVRDAISNFQKIRQNVGSVAKLELTIMMCYDVDLMESGISQALSNVNLTDICHVTGISLANNVFCAPSNSNQDDRKESTIASSRESISALNGILEVSKLDCDHLSIETTMRNWLADRNIDKEHLHLQFSNEKQLIIKCDIRERLIDLAELPVRHYFEISLDGMDLSQVGKNAVKHGNLSPITVLRAVKRVLCASLCESLIFGKPLLLYSSSCWQMEWDELEKNQNYFSALCKSLVDSKQALICENITQLSARRNSPQKERPFGLFLIMASENLNSLLLKSLSCRELLLTAQVPCELHWQDATNTAMEDVSRAMQAIEYEPEFNPLLISSGLIDFLKVSAAQNSSLQRREPARRFPAQHQNQTEGNRSRNSRNALFQTGSSKPAAGKAARFVAPRQNVAFRQHTDSKTFESDVPTITLTDKQGQPSKTVTFPDFTQF